MLKNALAIAVLASMGTAYTLHNASTELSQADSIPEQTINQPQDAQNTSTSISANPPETTLPIISTVSSNLTQIRSSSATNATEAKKFFSKITTSLQRGDNVFLTGNAKNPLHAVTPDDAKNIILQGGKHYLNAGEQDDLTLMTSKRDDLGNVIFKYSQTYNDLPVFGREIVVQINNNDEVTMIGGQYEPSIELNTTPKLIPIDALHSAFSKFNPASTDTPTMLAPPQLLVYTDENTTPVLAYKAPVEYISTVDGYRKEWLIVNANTGDVINRITMMHSAFNYSIHSMDNQCLSSNGSGLPGSEISASDGDHAAGVDANSGHAYHFFQQMFGRDSWDNNGRKLVSTIHVRFQGSNGSCNSDNAYFTGDQLMFGDGDNNLNNPGAAIDIFSHEFAHGFTSAESNLTYQNQSGALNESLSDIMGTGVSIWQRSGGTASANPSSFNPTDADWDMGEDAALTQSWQRHMDDPEENGQSKDDYNDRYTGSDDSGGVHTNSGISNLAFYLLSEGGQHPRGNTTNTVTGVGAEKALQIYYYANNNLFTSSTNFENARAKLATAAKTLYGCEEWESVQQSFDAVNVPGTRSDECDTGGDTGGDTGDDTGGDTSGDTGGDTPPPPSGNNIAVGSAYQASSRYSRSYRAQNSTDDNHSSYWVSRNINNPYAEEYVMMNLGSTKSFSSLNINWGGSDAAGSIVVWVWNNGRWNMAGSKSGSPATGVSFSTQQAQYVLLTMKNGWYRRWYAISEISIQ